MYEKELKKQYADQNISDLKEIEDPDYDDEDFLAQKYLNHYILTAELHRNLGNFDECIKMINAIPKFYDWLKRQYLEKCKEEDRMVFQIKPKKEKPAKAGNPIEI